MAKNAPNRSNNYAFIDNQNLNLGVQKMGWKMNWRRFRVFLKERYNVEKAFMFIGYMPDYEPLYNQMHELGFLVVLKPTIEMFNTSPKPDDNSPNNDFNNDNKSEDNKTESKKPEEKKPVKGNVDAELVLYAVKEMPNYDKAIVVSGDGDFYSLLEYLDTKGKLANLLTPNWQYSSLLKPFDKKIVRLDHFQRTLEYHDRPNK